MSTSLLVTGVICILSLVGAVVLFKFLKSSALIKNKTYQAGGAIAGFIIIFLTLIAAYNQLEKNSSVHLKEELAKAQLEITSLRESSQQSQINGKIIPYNKYTKIVLAVNQTDPDSTGQFRLLANCIDPEKDDVKIYVISENGGYKSKAILSKQEMADILIKLK